MTMLGNIILLMHASNVVCALQLAVIGHGPARIVRSMCVCGKRRLPLAFASARAYKIHMWRVGIILATSFLVYTHRPTSYAIVQGL